MALTGNLGELELADDVDLVEAFPGLSQFLPKTQGTWEPQRDLGKKHALKAFREATGKDPACCRALDNQDWELVLVAFTLAVIFRGFLPSERWLGKANEADEVAAKILVDFRYQEDVDRDGVIEESKDESMIGIVRTVNLVR